MSAAKGHVSNGLKKDSGAHNRARRAEPLAAVGPQSGRPSYSFFMVSIS